MGEPFEVRITWGDCDAAGIVFYPNYFYWMDNAFQALLRSRGLSQHGLKQRFGAVTPIVETGAKFLATATMEDVLTIEAAIERWSEKSMRVSYTGRRDGTPIFEGFEARVWVVPDADGTFKAAAIPAAFKDAMA